MNFAELDKVCEVDTKKLYEEVCKTKIPFYQWPKWIEAALGHIYLEKMYVERQRRRARRLEATEVVRRDIESHIYFAGFRLIESHFYSGR